ncbi:UNVERIFIED_CONTAM: hypothetical protein GTU68_022325 [Idotea baltica]|nr:hypothetical protein [Idotea baltica]
MFSSIKEDIAVVFDRDPAARHTLEILTTYPGVHAIIFHRFSHALSNKGLKWLARWLSSFSRFITGIEIHPGAKIGRRFFIDHGMGIVIGETAEIGDDCSLYHGVTLGGTSWNPGKRHPTLGNNVVVGAGAKILGPILVNDGARIGSNAVVVKEVPSGATIIGVPGRQFVKRETEQGEAGATQDMPDPVADTVNRMLDHIHEMDDRMDKMCTQLCHLGSDIDFGPAPSLKDIEMLDCGDNKKS